MAIARERLPRSTRACIEDADRKVVEPGCDQRPGRIEVRTIDGAIVDAKRDRPRSGCERPEREMAVDVALVDERHDERTAVGRELDLHRGTVAFGFLERSHQRAIA